MMVLEPLPFVVQQAHLALKWRRTAVPSGKMPGSTAGRIPAATGKSGGGNGMRPTLATGADTH